MKKRILNGWTFTRVLYLGMGIVIIIQSLMQNQGFGILFGSYLASMGIFAFGCAGGNCFGASCRTEPILQNKTEITDIEFKEVKEK